MLDRRSPSLFVFALWVAAACDSGNTDREDASEPSTVDASSDFDAGDFDSSEGDGPEADSSDESARDAGSFDAEVDDAGDSAAEAGVDATVQDGAANDGGTPDSGVDAASNMDVDASVDASPPALDAGDGALPAPACDDDNAGITLPRGFCATRFAEGLSGPRHMVVTPAGDLFVACAPRSGTSPSFVALRDADHDGKAERREQTGNVPGNGIDWRDGYLYFAANTTVTRYPLASGALTPSGDPVTLVRSLPATPDHYAKTVQIWGSRLFVNIGSATNSCQRQNRALESPGVDPCSELDTRGGVWLFDANRPDQTQADGMRFATGTRNANALALDRRGELFAAQNSRDQLNENWPELFSEEDDQRLPAEGIFQLEQGDDYGWPYCYYDAQAARYFLSPEYGGDGETVGRCADIKDPISTLPAHWAPLGMAFYDGTQFPERYRRGAFIANHGSRFAPSASEPLPGYNVVFIPFTDTGSPAGPFERFAEDFAGSGRPLPDAATHRPVGVAVAPDGALFVSDDKGGTIYRIVYRGE